MTRHMAQQVQKKERSQATFEPMAAPLLDQSEQGAQPGLPLFLDARQAWAGNGASSPPAERRLPTASPFLQRAALRIGAVNDPLEREAEEVAGRIVGGQTAGAIAPLHAATTAESAPQQAAATSANTAPPQLDQQLNVALASGGGKPLPSTLRSEMEQGFAADFSAVRLHDDVPAKAASTALAARAFTLGADIYLGAGESPDNRHLLAHELTHVVQQTGHSHCAQPCRHNSAYSRIQRWSLFGPDPDLTVEEVLNRQDADLVDNLEPARRTGAPAAQKLGLIRLLANQGWVGPEDEGLLVELWGSFGDLPSVAGSNLDLWRASVAGGADLASLQVVRDWQRDFENDVKSTARGYLSANRRYVEQEMTRMGIGAEGADQPMDVEQQAAVAEMQAIAADVQRAMTVRGDLQRLVVGYDLVPESRPGLIGLATMGDQSAQDYAEEVVERRGRRALDITTFTPLRPPHHPPFGDESPAMASYQQVKECDDNLQRYIAGYANRYPAIYALIRDERVEEAAAPNSSPEQARQTIAQVLRQTLTNIDATAPKIDSGDLDWRDLVPIHEQLKNGGAAASHAWGEGFGQWVIDDLLGDYQAREFWLQLGLTSLAAAAFVVAELATFGSATFFIAAGLAIGISAAQATMAWENYEDLAVAAGSNVSDETEIVSQGQASAEMFRAVIDTAMALLAVYGVASRAAGAARTTATAAAATDRAAMVSARGLVNQRIAFLRQRIASILSRRYSRSQVVEMCERQLEEVHQSVLRNVAAIREGRIGGLQGLSQAQRDELAEQLLSEVGATWRQAQGTVRAAAERTAVEVVPVEGGGYGASGLGSPPVRRPPSGHYGEGWERGW